MTIDEVIQKIKKDEIKVVIFDFDNTICDLNIKWDIQVGKLLRKYDSEVSLSGGYIRDNLMNSFLEKYGEQFREEWRELSSRFENDYTKGCIPLKRVVSLIQKLENVELWIWSSNSEETVKKYVNELGLLNKFSKFITRDSVDYIKPSPEGFFKQKKDVETEEVLMIGNAKNDRLAAEAIGISYIDVKDIDD